MLNESSLASLKKNLTWEYRIYKNTYRSSGFPNCKISECPKVCVSLQMISVVGVTVRIQIQYC